MSTPASDSKKLVFIDPEHVNHNLKVNKTIYEFLSVVAGLVCGVLGLTDLGGVLAFLVFNALIARSGLICGIKNFSAVFTLEKVTSKM